MCGQKYYDCIVQMTFKNTMILLYSCGQKYYDCIVQLTFKNTMSALYSCVVENTMIVLYSKHEKIL